jgi:excisionase family DNA binding protein
LFADCVLSHGSSRWPKTLRKWLREGAFPGVKVGRKWLLRAEDVEHALTHGRRGDHAVWVPADDASAPVPPADDAPAPEAVGDASAPEASAPRPRLVVEATPAPAPAVHAVPTPQQRKAEMISRLRAMKAQRLSYQAIANQLNAEGVPRLSGRGRWQKGMVSDLLAQEA